MGVKDLLKSQTAGYISLHDVLTRMTRIDGSTYQEAATALHRVLWEEDEKSRPVWHVCETLYGKRIATNLEEKKAWECLRQAALVGMPSVLIKSDELPF